MKVLRSYKASSSTTTSLAQARSCWSVLLTAILIAATTLVAPAARADSFAFSVNGGGIEASGQILVSPTSVAGTYQITGISGYFSDSNAGFSGAITGLESTVVGISAPPFSNPGNPALPFSYDNLFYPDGDSPLVCVGYPFGGGVFDIYGVLFDVAGGYTVDLWSNGIYAPGLGPDYELSDALGSTLLEPDDDGAAVPVSVTTAPTPEPGSMFLLGTGVLGLITVVTRRRVVHVNS